MKRFLTIMIIVVIPIALTMDMPAFAASNSNTWTAYPSSSYVRSNSIWPYFTPQMYDASCGQSSHDCTKGLRDCINAAYASGTLYASCLLAPGTYTVSSPILFCSNIEGVNSNKTSIAASAGFSGKYLLDFNCTHGSQSRIENLIFDLRALGASGMTTAWGSSSVGGGGGQSFGHGSNLVFLSSSLSTPVLHASSSLAEPGMLTGWVLTNIYLSAPCNLDIGNNQDDGTIIGLRSQITGACIHNGSGLSVTTNWKLIDSYVDIGVDNDAAPVQCGSNTDLDGIFVEGSGNSTADPWLIQYASGSVGPCIIDRLDTNVTMKGRGADTAIFRATVPDSATTTAGFIIGSYFLSSGVLPPTLFSIYNGIGTGRNGPLHLVVNGVGYDAFAGKFAKMGSGGVANTDPVLMFNGTFNGNSGTFTAPAPASGNAPEWTFSAPATSGIRPRGTVTF